jgi:hypothetical protein
MINSPHRHKILQKRIVRHGTVIGEHHIIGLWGVEFTADLTTNGVIITDAIKFVQTNKEKLMSKNVTMVKNQEPDYNDNKEHLEEEHEEQTGENATTNTTF